MQNPLVKWGRGLIACLIGVSSLAGAQAPQWPQKTVRIIVPSNPGGSADVLGRRVARQLEENLRQPFVVENRPGGGALIGSQVAVRSAPDGYTLLVHGVAAHVVPSKDRKSTRLNSSH